MELSLDYVLLLSVERALLAMEHAWTCTGQGRSGESPQRISDGEKIDRILWRTFPMNHRAVSPLTLGVLAALQTLRFTGGAKPTQIPRQGGRNSFHEAYALFI